ncbi:unnamed protein product [Discosporangium mesarthrocarpum]
MGCGSMGKSGSGQSSTLRSASAPANTGPRAPRERYKKLVIKAVIPAIKACKPRPEGHTTFVQQDGATPHTKVGIMEAIEEAVGGDIVIETQPANSPDLNVNDRGFFHSIQHLKE